MSHGKQHQPSGSLFGFLFKQKDTTKTKSKVAAIGPAPPNPAPPYTQEQAQEAFDVHSRTTWIPGQECEDISLRPSRSLSGPPEPVVKHTIIFVNVVSMDKIPRITVRLPFASTKECSVKHLREALSKRVDYPYKYWRLSYRRKPLDDEVRRLAFYQIYSRDSVQAECLRDMENVSTASYMIVSISQFDDVVLFVDPTVTTDILKRELERVRPDLGPMEDKIFVFQNKGTRTELRDSRRALHSYEIDSGSIIELLSASEWDNDQSGHRGSVATPNRRIRLDDLRSGRVYSDRRGIDEEDIKRPEQENERIQIDVHLTDTCYFVYEGFATLPVKRIKTTISERYNLPEESVKLHFGLNKHKEPVSFDDDATFVDLKNQLRDTDLCWNDLHDDGTMVTSFSVYLDPIASQEIRIFDLRHHMVTYKIPCFIGEHIQTLCQQIPAFMKDDDEVPSELQSENEPDSERRMNKLIDEFENGVFLCDGRVCDPNATVAEANIQNDSFVVIVPEKRGGNLIRLQVSLEEVDDTQNEVDVDHLRRLIETIFQPDQTATTTTGFSDDTNIIDQLPQIQQDARAVQNGDAKLIEASPADVMAVRLFTVPSVSRTLNRALAEERLSDQWKLFLSAMVRGLRCLPIHRGRMYVWRGMHATMHNISEIYTIGKQICEKRIIVGSTDLDLVADMNEKDGRGGVLFVIETKSARKLGEVSSREYEKAALLLPYSNLIVKHVVLPETEEKTDDTTLTRATSVSSPTGPRISEGQFPTIVYLKHMDVPRSRKFVVWVDDIPDGNKEFIFHVEKRGISVITCTSTDEAVAFLDSCQWILDLKESEIRLVTDRARIENGVENKNAGIDLIRVLRVNYHCNHKIMIFCGHRPSAVELVGEANLGERVFVGTESREIMAFLDFDTEYDQMDVRDELRQTEAQ